MSLCRSAVIKQEVELALRPFACMGFKKVSLLYLRVPCLFTLSIQKLSTFEASLHPWSNCWKLDRTFTGCWGDIKAHTEAVLLCTPHFLRKSWLSQCVWWRQQGVVAAALTESQELRNRLGRREWTGNSVEEEEASAGMCVGESGLSCLLCFDQIFLQSCQKLLDRSGVLLF